MPLLFLEFLGTTELLVILVAALVLFGPRKLPQLSHSLGKSLSEFKKASAEFQQTWERETADISRVGREALAETNISTPTQTTTPSLIGQPDETATVIATAKVEHLSDAHQPEQVLAAAQTPALASKREWI